MALSFGQQIGAGAISSTIGAGFGAIQAGINNAFQAKARKENYEYGEKAADNAQRRQMQFYEKYMTPQARMEMLEEAGLSKSLMSSGGVPAGQGGLAPQGSGSAGLGAIPMDYASIAAMQDTMASARLKNVQADVLEGENPRGEAEIQEILAEAGEHEASAAWSKVKAEFQEIQNKISKATEADQIKKISEEAKQAGHNAVKASWEALSAQKQYEFDAATFDARVEAEFDKQMNLLQDYLNKLAEGQLTQEQIKKVAAETKKITSEIGVEARKNEIYKKSVEGQIQWYKDQIQQRGQQFTDQLNFDKQKWSEQLDQAKTEMWLDFTEGVVTEVLSDATSILGKGITIGDSKSARQEGREYDREVRREKQANRAEDKQEANEWYERHNKKGKGKGFVIQ